LKSAQEKISFEIAIEISNGTLSREVFLEMEEGAISPDAQVSTEALPKKD